MNYGQFPPFAAPRGFFMALGVGGRLTPKELKQLQLQMTPKKMLETDRDRFLAQVSWRVDAWEKSVKLGLSSAEISERIADLEAAGKCMRLAIHGLETDAFHVLKMNFDYLTWTADPLVELPEVYRDEKPPFDQALEAVWTGVNMLQALGEFARSEMNIDRSFKQSEQRVRSLVHTVVEAWAIQFGELPPTGKKTWFFAMIRALGEIVGLEKPIGSRLVDGVIESMRNPDPCAIQVESAS